jgi:hypothetical protein
LIAFNLEDRNFIVMDAEAARQLARDPDGVLRIQALAMALLGKLIE